MDGVLETPEISTSTTSVVLNGSVFNFSTLAGEGEKTDFAAEKFDTVTPSNLAVIPESGSGGRLQGLIVDTSRGLAVLSVGAGGVGQVTLNGMVGDLHNASALLSSSDLPAEHPPVQLFDEHGDVSSDSQALNTTADPNELQLVTSSTHTAVGAVSTTNCLEIDEPKRKRGGWPKGKRRKPVKETFAPKAPASAYVLFAIGRRPAVKNANPSLSFVEITKLLGTEWSHMAPQNKQKYLSMAEADKQRYIDELKSYQQSDAYQNYLKKKNVEAEGDQRLDGSVTENSSYVTDLDSEELYCKVCDMYFSSQHNRKEHLYGKQHLQNVTSEFEIELKKEKEEQLAESEALNSDLAHDMFAGSLLEQQESDEHLDMESFIQRFIQKNQDREMEISELQKSLDAADKKNLALVTRIQELKELESNLEQDLGTLKAYGASLNAQIDGLKMVPTLFGVINF